jgi:FkbM family methyltransferase
MQNKQFGKNLLRGINRKISSVFTNKYKKVNLNWFSIKKYKHLPAGKVRTHRLFNKNISFYSPAELLAGLDEIFMEEIYKQDLPPNPFIIDCGANIGLSVIYMKQHYPGASIVAFEPDELNFDLLSKNIKEFGYTGIELRKEAAWIENSTVKFRNEGTMGSKIEGGVTTEASTREVKATRIKDMLTNKVNFLKIDIEGAEYHVLKDCADSLSVVENLFIEYHGQFQENDQLVEILQIIGQNNFSFYIKEATSVYNTPFSRNRTTNPYDIQLNIFCFRNPNMHV